MTRWWKCDLQVATPWAKDFRGPSDSPWNLEDDVSRGEGLRRYMQHLRAAGVEVVALADHNDARWASEMMAAGEREDVSVFPGVEVTTGSGADGVHIIIIGERDKSLTDFEDLLSRVCGFGGDHPRFDPVRGTPASAPKTLMQILDDLPEGFLAIAPHAFNDNGIAGRNGGDLRWKALHHERLAAVDVGDPRSLDRQESWRGRFIRRELSDFPRLPGLAFVSTSDAYALEDLGRRFTWIRMAEPTLEGLRQAFLDHEVRVACDWDTNHPASRTPNEVGHAWVRRVSLRGLNTATEPVEIELDPRLTVIIGGRGSGKSSVVAALRLLYGDVEGLPDQAAAEFSTMRSAVFARAELVAVHHLAHSGEQQEASWTEGAGRTTTRADASQSAATVATGTDFKIRVINQKELFERAAHSAHDPSTTSRNLLILVDDALATGSAGPGGPAAVQDALEEAQTTWISAARAHQAELEATSQRDVVAARVQELRRQVAAFDAPESKSRRERNDLRAAQHEWLTTTTTTLNTAVAGLREQLEVRVPASEQAVPTAAGDALGDADRDFESVQSEIAAIPAQLRIAIIAALDEADDNIARLPVQLEGRPWNLAVDAAAVDARTYRDELEALGVDPATYDDVRGRLAREIAALEGIDERLARLTTLAERAAAAWRSVEALTDSRRGRREKLLHEVADRSGLLRFRLKAHADASQWTRRVRSLLNLRADGFLEDVPTLARWLWGAEDETEVQRRHQLWRQACVTGDLEAVGAEAAMRVPWQQRIASLDPVVRARLGSEIADDVVEMEFLQDGGNPTIDSDWKPLTAGSPGQRSAAMLSFVMHHGIEPLVLDQPEDDLDTEWITQLVVSQLRTSRWTRQLVIVTHNANIPVNADAERIIVMENHDGGIRVRKTIVDEQSVAHVGALEQPHVRNDIQQIMEGGVAAFVRREKRYNNELNTYRAALQEVRVRAERQ